MYSGHIASRPARYDELLTEHLPELLATFDTPPAWWFHRHRVLSRPDEDQHLALYLHLSDPLAYGPAAQRRHDWDAALRTGRLLSHWTLASYEPQEGRYGHGPAMDAAHAVFAADSAAAVAQIRLSTAEEIDPRALAAASMTELATHFFPLPGEGLEWLGHHVERGSGPLDRSLRDTAFALTDAPDHLEGTELGHAWESRAAAPTAYHARLAGHRDPATVLRSLLHQHHIRAVSVNPEVESVTTRLTRACALSRIARTKAAE